MTNKKLAAAMAAVNMYVKTEEEAAVAAMQNQAADAAANALVSAPVGQMKCLGPFRAAGDYECQRNDTAKNAEIIK